MQDTYYILDDNNLIKIIQFALANIKLLGDKNDRMRLIFITALEVKQEEDVLVFLFLNSIILKTIKTPYTIRGY